MPSIAQHAVNAGEVSSYPTLTDLLARSRDARLDALCRPHVLGTQGRRQIESIPLRARSVKAGGMLFSPGEGLHAVYLVRAGMFKTQLVNLDGDRQITGFHFPNELIGLDAFRAREHDCYATAVVASRVQVLPIHRLNALMRQVPALAETMTKLLSENVTEYEQLLMLTNTQSALGRVAGLLFSFACRLGDHNQPADVLYLPMSRASIANYLGLALETVSRTLHELETRDIVLRRNNKTIDIRDLDALAALIGITTTS